MKPTALTLTGNGILRVITSAVGIQLPTSLPADSQVPIVPNNYTGIWDTGATGSVITQKVIDDLKLKPTGMTQVSGVHGTKLSNQYLVNISLINNVVIQSVIVTEGQINGADVLIGMDIINLGDFTVTNHSGQTVMSFRMPSMDSVDYVKQIKAGQPMDSHIPRSERRRQEKELAKEIRKQRLQQ